MIKNQIQRTEVQRYIYLFALALMICTLPLSRYLLSISQFILILNWFAEGNFKNRFAKLKENPAILIFASVFLWYVAGYLFSENSKTALMKIKNVLPLVALPVVIGTSPALSARSVKNLLLLFCAAVFTASVICVIHYLIHVLPASGNFRDISVFMPHIRFAILINMAIVTMVYLLLFPTYGRLKRTAVFILIPQLIFLVAFLIFLRSFTGIIISGILLPVILINVSFRLNSVFLKTLLTSLIFISVVAVSVTVLSIWLNNFTSSPANPALLDTHTANHRLYTHDFSERLLENGHYVKLYICEPELEKEWNIRSSFRYTGTDETGQLISETLKRYLTSKGLRKDSAGIHALTTADILNIEKGIPNYTFSANPGIRQRIYESLWEIHVFALTDYVRQHTLGQRIAFLHLAGLALADSPLFGTGTGDVYPAMIKKAQQAAIEIDPRWEGKPHNQFAFLLIAFGTTGFLWILFSWIYPAIKHKAYRHLLFNLFAGVVIISMLVVDTLESYDSIVFYTLFYSLFVFNAEDH